VAAIVEEEVEEEGQVGTIQEVIVEAVIVQEARVVDQEGAVPLFWTTLLFPEEESVVVTRKDMIEVEVLDTVIALMKREERIVTIVIAITVTMIEIDTAIDAQEAIATAIAIAIDMIVIATVILIAMIQARDVMMILTNRPKDVETIPLRVPPLHPFTLLFRSLLQLILPMDILLLQPMCIRMLHLLQVMDVLAPNRLSLTPVIIIDLHRKDHHHPLVTINNQGDTRKQWLSFF